MTIKAPHFQALALALLVFTFFNPFFAWSTFEYSTFIKLIIFTLISPFIIQMILSVKLEKSDIYLIACCLPYLFYRYALNGDGISGILQFILSGGLIVFSILLMKNNIGTSYKYFSMLLGFFSINAILVWFLALGGFLKYSNFPTILPTEGGKLDSGINYIITYGVVWIDTLTFCFGSGCVNRLSGPFNEPGLFGTVVAFLICANKLKLNSWYFISMFVAGILSFSLAFYAIILIYALLVRFKSAVLCLSLCVFLLSISNIPFVESFLTSRVQVTESGLSGNNRSSDEFDRYFSEYVNSDEVLFGKGFQAHSALGVDVSSWKVSVYNQGVIGSTLFGFALLSLYFYFSKSPISKYSLAFFVAFVSSIYQRPDVLNFQFIFILICGLSLANDLNKKPN